jgi:hypothetical protein
MEPPSNRTWFLRKREDGSVFGPLSFEQLAEPVATGISIRLEQRIRDLEETLREERRALTEAEQRYAVLDRKYQQLAERLRT